MFLFEHLVLATIKYRQDFLRYTDCYYAPSRVNMCKTYRRSYVVSFVQESLINIFTLIFIHLCLYLCLFVVFLTGNRKKSQAPGKGSLNFRVQFVSSILL